MLQQHVKAEGKKGMRQSPERVAELVLRAMHHRVLLCWIVQHPILLLGMPDLARQDTRPPWTYPAQSWNWKLAV